MDIWEHIKIYIEKILKKVAVNGFIPPRRCLLKLILKIMNVRCLAFMVGYRKSFIKKNSYISLWSVFPFAIENE